MCTNAYAESDSDLLFPVRMLCLAAGVVFLILYYNWNGRTLHSSALRVHEI